MTYGIDADHLLVWIESLDEAITYRAGVLCRRHADAMVVPLGWMLDDRREPIPRLFKPREPVAQPAPRPRRQRVTVPRDETGQLELPNTDDAPDDAGDDAADESTGADEQAVAERTDKKGAPWKPVFDQNDDLDGLLVANSPLLSRAFGQRDPTSN